MDTLKCDCTRVEEQKITSIKQFKDLELFFNQEVENGIFKEIKVTEPYYIGHGKSQDLIWYADKWYICTYCKTLWEFNYPDFPAAGFVRKFTDGIYHSKEY